MSTIAVQPLCDGDQWGVLDGQEDRKCYKFQVYGVACAEMDIMHKSTQHQEQASVAPAGHCRKRRFPVLRCDKIDQMKGSLQATAVDDSSTLAMPIKFLINPVARAQGGQYLWNRLQEACARLGYVAARDYSLEWTRPGHAVEQARQAAADWDRVLAVGGDGTVRAVGEGLYKAGTGAVLGVIPQGTGNDFARATGIYQLWAQRRRLGIDEIVRRLATGPTTAVDVLGLNDQLCFMCYCGVGWDARVCRAYTQLRRHRTMQAVLRGRLINEGIYAMLALRYWATRLSGVSLQLDTSETGWTAGDLPSGTCAVIVSNVASYAGGAPLTAGSSPHDGQFEVTPIQRPWFFALLVMSRYWRRLRRLCPLRSQRVKGLQMSLPSGNALQVDGDDATEVLADDSRLSIRVAGQIPVVYALADPMIPP